MADRTPSSSAAPVDVASWSPTALRILHASAQLFAANGFAATSTRDIAGAVGIRQPGLYKHFSSKDAILVALYELGLRYPTEVARALRHRAEPAAVRLYRWLLETVTHLARDPLVLASLLSTRELSAPRFVAHRFAPDLGQRFCEHLIQAGIDEGSLLDRPAAAQAWFTLGLIDSTALPAPGAVTTDQVMSYAFDALLVDRRALRSIARRAEAIDLGLRSPLLDAPFQTPAATREAGTGVPVR